MATSSDPDAKASSKLRKYGKRAGYVVAALVVIDLLAGAATVALAAWLKP